MVELSNRVVYDYTCNDESNFIWLTQPCWKCLGTSFFKVRVYHIPTRLKLYFRVTPSHMIFQRGSKCSQEKNRIFYIYILYIYIYIHHMYPLNITKKKNIKKKSWIIIIRPLSRWCLLANPPKKVHILLGVWKGAIWSFRVFSKAWFLHFCLYDLIPIGSMGMAYLSTFYHRYQPFT